MEPSGFEPRNPCMPFRSLTAQDSLPALEWHLNNTNYVRRIMRRIVLPDFSLRTEVNTYAIRLKQLRSLQPAKQSFWTWHEQEQLRPPSVSTNYKGWSKGISTHPFEWVALTPMGNHAKLLWCGSSSLITPDTQRSPAVRAGWSTCKKGCSCR